MSARRTDQSFPHWSCAASATLLEFGSRHDDRDLGKDRVMKLTHLALWTADLEGSASFWSEYFDASVGDRYVSKNRPGFMSRFVTLPADDVRIELMEGPWVGPFAGEVCGWAHVAYSVGSAKSVDELAERFRRDGLLVSPPRRTGDGYYEAVVRSPEGVLIEIVE